MDYRREGRLGCVINCCVALYSTRPPNCTEIGLYCMLGAQLIYLEVTQRPAFHGKSTCAVSLLLTQYCSGDQMENEMGGACSAYGGEERCI